MNKKDIKIRVVDPDDAGKYVCPFTQAGCKSKCMLWVEYNNEGFCGLLLNKACN